MLEIPNPSLKERTTIRLGGRAIAELVIEKKQDLESLPQALKRLGGQPFFLGKGSNILASDGEIPYTLVRINLDKPPVICGEEDGKVLVMAQAGEPLSKILGFCLKNGLSGLEGLAGIPGSAGGAVMMNAGSFGNEIADCLHSVEIWVNGEIKTYKNNDLKPTYRRMEPLWEECPVLVAELILALTRRDLRAILENMSLNFLEKKSRQPITAWSGGCAFKNPAGREPAGKLLERAGFKGKELGGMAFSQKHANFLINLGGGSFSAAMELISLAQEEVMDRFGVFLEPELIIIP